MDLVESFIQSLIEHQRERPVNRVKRLEKQACRLYRKITGCKLEKSERFTSRQLIEIFCRQPPTTVEQLLTENQTQNPYCYILYWLWYYSVLA